MAEIFRIKNKKLRWIVGGITLLFLIAMAAFLLRYFCFGLGYGLYGFSKTVFSAITTVYHEGEPTAGDFVKGGFLILALIVFSCFGIWVFLVGAKEIGNKFFNSIGDSKKQEGS